MKDLAAASEFNQNILGDAIKYLEDCVAEKKQFDYIFGDLTDVPIDTDKEGKVYLYQSLIS